MATMMHARHRPLPLAQALLHLVWLCVLLATPTAAMAQLQAWLDHSQLRLGEVATLTIQTEQADAMPDYSALERDFLIYAPTLRRQSVMSGGQFVHQVQHAVGIEPRRTGRLLVPALRVGGQMTPALVLQVDPADAGGADGSLPALAFIRTRVDTPRPYVRQSVGVVVALYYAVTLASGELVQDAPPGSSLQRMGSERTDQAVIDGQHYNVVERRYLLLPERRGELVLPPARFNGRVAGGGHRGRMLSAEGTALSMQVQPEPAAAPSPWLPLHDLRLGYTGTPGRPQVGQGVELLLEAELDGATRAQLDELPLPAAGPGYRLYAQATEVEEYFDADRPQLRLRRRFTVVPERAGELVLPAVSLAWWQVEQGQLRRTTQPAIALQVAAAGAAAAAVTVGQGAQPATTAAAAPRQRWWPWLATAFALAWLATLVWALGRRGRPARRLAQESAAPAGMPALAEQLHSGSVHTITEVLCRMGGVQGRAQLLERLADAEQRQALEAAQRAWWAAGEGDRVGARARLRAAFANGPRWHPDAAAAAASPTLPPLYPPA